MPSIESLWMETMSTFDPCQYLDSVLEIAQNAGRRILDVYEREFAVKEKGDGSPLTEADRLSNETIMEGLHALTPDIPVLSEESARAAYSERKEWTRFWLVDPLDGTKEFVNRNNEFTVNIALIEDGRPVLGVVYVPALGLTYHACVGRGAFRNRADAPGREIKVRHYGGSKPMIVASRSHAGDALKEFIERVGEHDLVSMGSSLKLCLVAEGTADVYPRLGPTMEWDTAAAQCIVEVAGGRVVDCSNVPLRYNKENLLNPWFIVSGADAPNWTQFVPAPKPS